MTMQWQLWFWASAVALFAIALFVLRDAVMPFVAGMILAYLLHPLASRLQRWGLSRLVATLVITGLMVLIFVLALMVIIPIGANQLSQFVAKLPDTVGQLQSILARYGGPVLDWFGLTGLQAGAEKSMGEFVGQGAKWFATALQSLIQGGRALMNVVSLLVITPVVAFYLLLDWNRMVASVDRWLPRDHRDTIRGLFVQMDAAISGFLRGQALVCLLLGTFYAVGLTLIGLNFGALIGMLSGLLSFIPFVGSLIGLLLSVGVAVVQFWPDWTMPLAALAIFGVGQFLEGNILSPKLVGDSVGLHPVWLMFALIAFGSLFGFLGLLLAVPIAATIGVLSRFALGLYLDSAFYRGNRDGQPTVLPEDR